MITRKQFLKAAAPSAAVAATAPGLTFLSAKQRRSGTVVIRIRPIAGKSYSPSFLRLCKRGRFRSVREAMKRVKDRSVEYLLLAENG